MIRLAAFAAVIAGLVAASLVWADERPSNTSTGPPTTDAGRFVKGSITTRGIRNGTIRMRDLHRAVRRLIRSASARGEDGEDGLDGLDGVDGLDGLDGLDGVSGYAAQSMESPGPEQPGASATAEVDCPEGTSLLGGGVVPESDDPAAAFDVRETRPQDDNSGWRATVVRTAGTGAWRVDVRAFCADVTP